MPDPVVPQTGSLQPAFAMMPNPHPPNLTQWKGWPSEEQQCDEQGCWPRLFIIGTQKGASSSLFNVLHQEGIACGTTMNDAVHQALPSAFAALAQPLLFTAGGLIKEAHMLDMSKPDWRTLMERPELYRSLYRIKDCPQRTFLDATPKYIRHPGAPSRLVELMPASWLPQLRVVLSIREPVARDLSWFNHKSATLGRLSKNDSRAGLVSQFCSLSEDSSWGDYPTYEREVSCRKQELSNCMNAARLRLNEKNAGTSRNVSKGYDASSLEDYSECMEATWHNKRSRSDPTRSEWDDESAPRGICLQACYPEATRSCLHLACICRRYERGPGVCSGARSWCSTLTGWLLGPTTCSRASRRSWGSPPYVRTCCRTRMSSRMLVRWTSSVEKPLGSCTARSARLTISWCARCAKTTNAATLRRRSRSLKGSTLRSPARNRSTCGWRSKSRRHRVCRVFYAKYYYSIFIFHPRAAPREPGAGRVNCNYINLVFFIK